MKKNRPIAQVISELRDMQSEIRDYGKLPRNEERTLPAATHCALPTTTCCASLMAILAGGDVNASLQSLVGAIDTLAQQNEVQQALLVRQQGQMRQLCWQVARMRQGFLGRFIRDDQRRSLRAVFGAWAAVSGDREAAVLAASLKDAKLKARQERMLRAWRMRAAAAAMRSWEENASRRQRALRLMRRVVMTVRNRALLWCA